MSKLKIVGIDGAPKGDMEIPDSILCVEGYSQAVHDVAVAVGAGRRAGTASTLRKGEVAGSNKKPWRQKGTGQARAGYKQSPVWRGGGVAFGPHPRSFEKRLPKKVWKKAFVRAVSDRIASGAVKVVDKLELPEAKTKVFKGVLKAMDVQGPALILLNKADPKIMLAARNLQGVEVVLASEVNAWQIIKYPILVVDSAAMNCLKQRLERDVA